MRLSALTPVVGLAFLVGQAQAAPIQTHDFESPITTGTLDTQDGFSADSGVTVVSGGLDYTSGTVNSPGGSQRVSADNDALSLGGSGFAFSNTFTSQTGDVYFSFAATWNTLETNFVYFGVSDDADLASLTNSAGVFFSGGGTTLNGRIRSNSSSATNNELLAAISATETQTQLIVGRLYKDGSTNYNKLDLWLNPDSDSAAADLTITRDMGVESVDTFYLRGSTTDPGAAAALNLDNIRLGTTLADVAIPEPASLALLGLGGLCLLSGRRKV